MTDAYLLLTPLLMLGVLALVRFVGCNLVFQAEPDQLDAPLNLVARPGNQRVELTWEPVEEADGYIVKRAAAPGGPYDSSFDLDGAQTSFSDGPLPNGVTVFYVVAAQKGVIEGDLSNEASATPAIGLITFKTLGTARNNFTGPVGMVIQVGAVPVNAVGLGRIFVAGNSGTHTLRIAESVNGVTLPGASVAIDFAAASATAVPNEFAYAAFPTPVLLAPNTEFYVLTEETDGGDQWFDQDTTVATTSPTVPTAVANVTNAVSALGATFVRSGGPGHTFGPVDLLF